MAKRTRLIAPELAHGFGLFCDIGIPFLKPSFPTYLATLALANRKASTRSIEIERSRHGVDHATIGATIGAMLAQERDLDADIVLAIRLHHSYGSLRDTSIAAELRAMIAAKLLVEKAIQEFRKETLSLQWQVGGDATIETLGLDHNEIEEICHELKQLF